VAELDERFGEVVARPGVAGIRVARRAKLFDGFIQPPLLHQGRTELIPDPIGALIELQRLAELGDGIVRSTEGEQRACQLAAHRGALGIEFDGTLEIRQGLVRVAL
jgi:hypothetical protein